MNVNLNLMGENVVENKIERTINADVSIKNIVHVKKIIFAILLHAVARIVNIYPVLIMI